MNIFKTEKSSYWLTREIKLRNGRKRINTFNPILSHSVAVTVSEAMGVNLGDLLVAQLSWHFDLFRDKLGLKNCLLNCCWDIDNVDFLVKVSRWVAGNAGDAVTASVSMDIGSVSIVCVWVVSRWNIWWGAWRSPAVAAAGWAVRWWGAPLSPAVTAAAGWWRAPLSIAVAWAVRWWGAWWSPAVAAAAGAAVGWWVVAVSEGVAFTFGWGFAPFSMAMALTAGVLVKGSINGVEGADWSITGIEVVSWIVRVFHKRYDLLWHVDDLCDFFWHFDEFLLEKGLCSDDWS